MGTIVRLHKSIYLISVIAQRNRIRNAAKFLIFQSAFSGTAMRYDERQEGPGRRWGKDTTLPAPALGDGPVVIPRCGKSKASAGPDLGFELEQVAA